MAKVKAILCGLLYVSVAFCAAYAGTVTDQDAVIATAEGQLYVREQTGRNDGIQVETYLQAVGRKKGDAWCAAFVSWCFQVNCIKVPKSGWSPSWFPADHTVYVRGRSNNERPHKADVFGIYFSNLKRIAHVGLVQSWSDKYVITIEGNTSGVSNTGNATREGDGVYRKRRLTNQIQKVSRWI